MPLPEAFQRIENEYYRLRGRFTAGRITAKEYELALNELTVCDTEGRYWTLGADSGEWYFSAGEVWVKTPPPEAGKTTSAAAEPTSPPAIIANVPVHPGGDRSVIANTAVRYGGFWRRVMAYLLDGLLLTILQAFVFQSMLQQAAWSIYSSLESFFDLYSTGITISIVSMILATLVSLAYFAGFWALAGRTPGQFLLRIKVVTDAGKQPGLLRSMVRCIGLLVASIPVGLGLLWVAFDSRKQGWHDKMARTFVVHV